MSTPSIRLDGPLSGLEYALYAVGWLVWVPSYVVALLWIYKHKPRRCLIPTIAVCGNVAFEGLWVFMGDFTHARFIWWVYVGAFLLDVPILIGIWIYGTFGAPQRFRPESELEPCTNRRDRMQHYVVVASVLVLWVVGYVALRYSYEVPLGSVGAYLDNTVMSALFVWLVWLYPDMPRSKWTAWSKFLGTFFVTIFVAIRYHGTYYSFLYFLAALSAVLDIWYVWLAHHPRRDLSVNKDHAMRTAM